MFTAPTSPIRIIRLAEVKRRTGLSTSSIYEAMARDEFPRQVALGSGTAVGWVESEIDDFIVARVRERDERWRRLEKSGSDETGPRMGGRQRSWRQRYGKRRPTGMWG